MKAIAIAYHDVFDKKLAEDGGLRNHPERYALAPENFRQHLLSIPPRQRGLEVGTINSFRRWSNEVPVFLTFDDGALCAYTQIAAELEKRNWRGHFFIVSRWIGRTGFMDAQQIRELRQRGHVIGSHSCSHPERMANLSRKELLQEWTESCSVLSELLGEQVRVASVPNGYYSRAVGETAAAAGIEVLFNSEPTTTIGVVGGCLLVGRYSIKAGDSDQLTGLLVSRQSFRRRQTFFWNARKAAKLIGGPAYLAMRSMWLSRMGT